MAMTDYILPQNRGWQIWQMMASNATRGDHPYNVKGLCLALVVQWLLEIKMGGQAPDALARYLLSADLGRYGYGGIASSQKIYADSENRQAMVQRHSGGALTCSPDAAAVSVAAHWRLVCLRIYGIDPDGSFRLGQDQPRPYSGIFSISGNGLISILDWAHAIGVHSTAATVYIFDPNYGVFLTDATRRGTVGEFVKAIWADYGATAGNLVDIT